MKVLGWVSPIGCGEDSDGQGGETTSDSSNSHFFLLVLTRERGTRLAMIAQRRSISSSERYSAALHRAHPFLHPALEHRSQSLLSLSCCLDVGLITPSERQPQSIHLPFFVYPPSPHLLILSQTTHATIRQRRIQRSQSLRFHRRRNRPNLHHPLRHKAIQPQPFRSRGLRPKLLLVSQGSR